MKSERIVLFNLIVLLSFYLDLVGLINGAVLFLVKFTISLNTCYAISICNTNLYFNLLGKAIFEQNH